MVAFDPDRFVSRCVEALAESAPLAAAAEVVAEAVADPRAFAGVVDLPLDPDDDGILFRSPELMIVHVVFPSGFRTGAHDHRVPAVIGTWSGHEDNLLYSRTGSGIELREVRRVESGEVLVLDTGAIHDVHAPASSWTAGIHVYLGDLAAEPRSAWPDPGKVEVPCDADDMERRWLEQAIATGLVAAPP